MKAAIKETDTTLWIAVVVASVLWFAMFSPWTAPFLPFWPAMAVASMLLVSFARPWRRAFWDAKLSPRGVGQVLLGLGIAAVLWLLFWVGDKASSLLFDFARPQVEQVYGMKEGSDQWLVALQLLLLTGPAEELFWRGYVQRGMSRMWGENRAFVVATAIYALIHVWSFNFMLVMAALVCGVVWGGLYRLRPQWLPALVVSHAVWDACVFVLFPI